MKNILKLVHILFRELIFNLVLVKYSAYFTSYIMSCSCINLISELNIRLKMFL